MATKPFTDIAGQISILQERGMRMDAVVAAMWLSNVGYYRLSGYWYVYKELDSHGDRADTFLPGTSFPDITALYEFDRKLRTLPAPSGPLSRAWESILPEGQSERIMEPRCSPRTCWAPSRPRGSW